jgi:hypothetical protein
MKNKNKIDNVTCKFYFSGDDAFFGKKSKTFIHEYQGKNIEDCFKGLLNNDKEVIAWRVPMLLRQLKNVVVLNNLGGDDQMVIGGKDFLNWSGEPNIKKLYQDYIKKYLPNICEEDANRVFN